MTSPRLFALAAVLLLTQLPTIALAKDAAPAPLTPAAKMSTTDEVPEADSGDDTSADSRWEAETSYTTARYTSRKMVESVGALYLRYAPTPRLTLTLDAPFTGSAGFETRRRRVTRLNQRTLNNRPTVGFEATVWENEVGTRVFVAPQYDFGNAATDIRRGLTLSGGQRLLLPVDLEIGDNSVGVGTFYNELGYTTGDGSAIFYTTGLRRDLFRAVTIELAYIGDNASDGEGANGQWHSGLEYHLAEHVSLSASYDGRMSGSVPQSIFGLSLGGTF